MTGRLTNPVCIYSHPFWAIPNTLYHGGFLREHSGDPELASHTMHDYTQAKLDPQTRAMLGLRRQADPHACRPWPRADVQLLRNHGLNDEQILSTVLITCTFNFMTRLADSLGVEPPDGRQESHSQWMSEATKSQGWLMTPRT